MDALFDNIAAFVSLGAGLSTLSGLRAFLPLGLVGLVARYDLFGAFDLDATVFAVLENPWVIGILLILALIEITADKVPLLDSAQDLLTTPLRILAGALVFGAALAQQDTGVVVAGMIGGGALAGASHAAKGALRPGVTTAAGEAADPFVSFFEDIVAGVGSLVLVLVPLLGILLVVFVLLFIYRVRKRRQRKYKGLRILKE
ncbi:MAG: hypothetical protein Kow00122_19250 [Thermoleophilia bacterium]